MWFDQSTIYWLYCIAFHTQTYHLFQFLPQLCNLYDLLPNGSGLFWFLIRNAISLLLQGIQLQDKTDIRPILFYTHF